MVYLAGVNRAVDTGDTYFPEIVKARISGSISAKDRLAERDIIEKQKLYGGQPLRARIEYSRWIVDCPNCGGAEFVFEDKRFLCSQCGNSDIQGQIRRVVMPQKRTEIEDILSKRKIINRHWYPNETIEMLQENK